jgi:hypothetical protein
MLHHHRWETKEVYFVLLSLSVYLSDFLKVDCRMDFTEKYLVRSALILGSLQYFFHEFRVSTRGERPAMVGPSFVEA